MRGCARMLATPPPDPAVEVGPQRVVVDAGRASAVIIRDPLRISFRDSRGRLVLAQLPNRRPGPLVEPPTIDPEPGGVDLLPETTLYAPFSFSVGRQRILQGLGPGPFVGNLVEAERSGVQYSARRALSVRRS